MSYKNLLNQQALKAFNLLKDLSTDAVFVDKTTTGFNFDTKSVIKSDAAPVTLRLVVINTKVKENTITKTVIARFIDTGLLDRYDTLTFESKEWKVGENIQEVGQVTIFDIYREGTNG